jgi:hypothetical protein
MNDRDDQTFENAELVDARHPWLGLASFSEATQGFFYGREEEVAELARRVQRKLLTVLFGQSGLGKTSILRAGLAPRLRQQGYCPVYVRIDYSADAPPPEHQIKQAMLKETAAVGQWSGSGADGDEPLWEFLHRRDNVLSDARGAALVPLLIFDQFEEIFTLAQADDGGRQRAANFLDTLAGLVENRPSPALEQRMDEDDDTASQFDFSRSDYRVLVTLREDYLAHLEGIKGTMPSITQNRQRLAPMTGAQALAAVTGPGGELVTAEVAEAIVRFVAGGAELANAQVEPSLLSLICRELNDKRIAARRDAITIDLLAGSHASILSDFYERALADQPEAVRAVVEDILLTDSGYRENVAEERVRRALAAAGASGGALAALVDRRLLRIEERLDVRRVELTHDVLCGVVKASRERRLEREQLAEAERNLARQRERELESRRALARARKVAAVCAVLSVCAVGSTVFGYVNMRRAENLRAVADRSRAGAENLVGYLLDDFYETLRPTGRLDMLGELAGRTVTYYGSLDAEMRGADTALNQARAMTRLAAVRVATGKREEAQALADRALASLQQLSKGDPASEPIARAYASGLLDRAQLAFGNGDRQNARIFNDRARAVILPFFRAADASAQVRSVYSEVVTRSGFMHLRGGEDGAETDFRMGLDAVKGLTDIRSRVDSIDAGSWLHELIVRTNRADEAEKIGADVMEQAESVLKRVPNHKQALKVIHQVNFDRAVVELRRRRQPGRASKLLDLNLEQGKSLLMIEPDSVSIMDTQSIDLAFKAASCLQLGNAQEARDRMEEVWKMYEVRKPSAYHSLNLALFAAIDAEIAAQRGRADELERARGRLHQYGKVLPSASAEDMESYKLQIDFSDLRALSVAGDRRATPAAGAELVARLDAFLAEAARKNRKPADFDELIGLLAQMLFLQAELANAHGEFAVAEAAGRRAFDLAGETPRVDPLDAASELRRVEYAHALVRTGKLQQARVQVDKAIAIQRAQLKAGSDDQMLRLELARALAVSALASPDRRAASLREASALLAGLPPEVRQLRLARLARERVDAVLRAP